MTPQQLAAVYLHKAQARLKILDVLVESQDYSDVVREAQEIVELALKGMLRSIGVEPPKYHDVGELLIEHSAHFAKPIREDLKSLADISKWLRKEREFSFYGDIDFNPLEEYAREDAQRAIDDAQKVVRIATAAMVPSRQDGSTD